MNVVVLGGGTGLSTVLRSLMIILKRKQINFTVTAGCAASDNGGDTGEWVKEFGLTGYIGDYMKCALALCPHENRVKMFAHREESGSMRGRIVRNFVLVGGIKKVSTPDGDPMPAFQEIFAMLDTLPHRVFPVSIKPTTLFAEVEIDEGDKLRIATIKGQSQIALYHKRSSYDPLREKIRRVIQEPEVPGYSPIIEAISKADVIVVAMGSLLTSIVPALLPHGIKEAMAASKAPIIHPLNLMIHDGESRGMQGHQFLEKIESVIGKPLDHILYSFGDRPVPLSIAKKYKDARMVSYFPGVPSEGKPVYGDSLLDKRVTCTPLRSYANETISHDVVLLARALEKILLSL